ncbi:MerR family DNA-binding protein [Helicobacter bizzozeronii]|uniref:MerR family DNA-binding protein n=1 Tax=Helicobacter bizzozeronii TaxID=56877 RepID=UPI0003129105|nr:MerR family DNA-binding protein [Helicobacter bizzozeronii]
MQCLRACGMPLATIKDYIYLSQQGMKSAPQRKAILEQQLKDLRLQLDSLHKAEAKIAHKIELYSQMIAEQKDFLNPSNPAYAGKPKKNP